MTNQVTARLEYEGNNVIKLDRIEAKEEAVRRRAEKRRRMAIQRLCGCLLLAIATAIYAFLGLEGEVEITALFIVLPLSLYLVFGKKLILIL